ncbi:MAG: glycoside hydrolase family 78 protein [Armatimonadota bacterium]|nr:glycoside hydrolase family 78 protein [Armatimonadota bacterium]
MRVCLILSLLFTTVLTAVAPGFADAVTVTQLRCEYASNPLGIDVTNPRLSWIMESTERGQRQTAYQIIVASDEQKLAANKGDLWYTGKVASDQSAHIIYAGKYLASRMRCWWKIRVWDKDGKVSPYSKPAYWEMGLRRQSDWRAKWIECAKVETTPAADDKKDKPSQPPMQPCSYARKPFISAKPIKRARLYVSALGFYEAYINGRRIGDDVLAPGWTDYHKRVQYQTYDVTAAVRKGQNVIGVILGDGWFCGYIVSKKQVYGQFPRALCQLTIDYTDGATQTIITDESWKTSTGPILQSDMLMGETYDARKEMPGWSEIGFDDSAWQPIMTRGYSAKLDAQRGPSVRRKMEIKTRTITEPAKGVYVFDLGQNMVGWARLRVKGSAGDKIRIRFAEMLKPDGNIYTDNLRGARCIDNYILKGVGEEVYEPRFTYHGFRYVELTGFPGKPSLDSITGIVIHSDTPPTGVFQCSNPMINKLQSNILWGQRGNFVSIPTDCPQRDERLGWTGDAQVFIRTAAFNMDVSGFFTKWLLDLEDSQAENGAFPNTAPKIYAGPGVAGWSDAGVICPWTIYLCYGDKRIIEQRYDSMVKWVEFCRLKSDNLIRPAAGFGDWLAIGAHTPEDLIATAYFAYSARLLSKIAAIIGKDDDARKYEELFQQIKTAFNNAYVQPDGRVKSGTQTSYLLALRFDLIPEDKRKGAVDGLVEVIREKDWRLSTGFLGVSYLLPTLTHEGHHDVAYRLLNNDTFPSWLFPVKHGATTIWERWDGWTSERGFQNPGMNSFNHYSLGSVGEWMYETIAGISADPGKPGYKHIIIRPQPGGGLAFARGSLDSIYGKIATCWTINNGVFTLNLTIPANTTATVYIPASEAKTVTESGKPADKAIGVKFLRMEYGAAVYEVGSGNYAFKASVSTL